MLPALLACVTIPDAPPPSTPEAPPEPPPLATPGFDACGALVSVDALGGGGYDLGVAAAPAGDDALLAIVHDAPLRLDGDPPVRVAPLGEAATLVARLGPDGAARWATSAQGTTQLGVTSVRPADDGGAFVTGAGDGLSTLGGVPLGGRGEADGFVARLASDGSVAWRVSMASREDDVLTSVVELADGDLVVVGAYGAAGALGAGRDHLPLPEAGRAGLVARLSPDGAVRWALPVGAADVEVRPEAVAARPDGGVVVAATVGGVGTLPFGPGSVTPAPPGSAVLLWVSGGGAPERVAEAGGAAVTAVGVGADGGVWAAGSVTGPATFGRGEPAESSIDEVAGGWVGRWTADGAFASLAATTAGEGGAAAIADLAVVDGVPVVAGRFAGPVALDDEVLGSGPRAGFVATVDPDGAWGCAVQLLADDPASLVWPSALGARPDGTVLVTGTFQGHARVGAGGPDETTLTARGAGDAFLVALALWAVGGE